MIPGYELIDELAGNETFRLYRGRQTSSGPSVLIKAPRHEPPWAAELAALRRECEIVKSLSIDTVSQPLVIEFAHGCVAIMEDTGGMPLTSWIASGGSELGPVLSIGIELVAIVDELHHRGMMHNGIRPGVIMWDPERLVRSADRLQRHDYPRSGSSRLGRAVHECRPTDLCIALANRTHEPRS